ncbi:hypothetical protein C0989_008346 [Termitomyces sp. Mn162]|nr:hypothetical protein C0989_008346 [Termitomyces sp. Mn162]
MLGLRKALRWLKNKLVEKAQRILLTVIVAGPTPRHVAFIMDGNRRYARIFAFAIDNFNRPEDEVAALMSLAEEKLIEIASHGLALDMNAPISSVTDFCSDLLNQYGVRMNVVGNVGLLPASVQKAVRRAERMTRHNNVAIFNLHMPYASRYEITLAVQSCVRNSIASNDDRVITEDDIDRQLLTSLGGSPPLDVLVRTSGVKRLSDYLLWQASFALMRFYLPDN